MDIVLAVVCRGHNLSLGCNVTVLRTECSDAKRVRGLEMWEGVE